MNILLTNDDGVSSPGILSIYNQVSDLGDVYIVAPSTQQSAVGRSMTIYEPVRMDKIELENNIPAYSVSGTPCDCALLGIFEVMDEKVDLVISGINVGHNTGRAELTTSGTVSAAMESASYGIPSLAVSQQVINESTKFDGTFRDLDFTLASQLTRKLAIKILDKGLPAGVDLLNLNIPATIESEDIKITNLASRMYSADIVKKIDPRGKEYYWIGGTEYKENREDTDSFCLNCLHQPSLTPVSLDTRCCDKDLLNW